MSASAHNQVPRLRLFTEARFHRGPDNSICAIDAASGASAWEPYRRLVTEMDLAARVGPPIPEASINLGDMAVYPLPYYYGPVQLIPRLPRLLTAISDAVGGARLSVIRLPGMVGFAAGTIARLRGRGYVVEVLGDPESLLRSGALGTVGVILAPAARVVMRWIVSGASAGRYVTDRVLQDKYRLPVGAPDHHYSNVRLGPSDLRASPREVTAPVRDLVAVGTQDQLYKGHDDLIRAVALLHARGISLRLMLVGDGRRQPQLRRLAAECGIAHAVVFAGRINDRRTLLSMLDDAGMFVHPSRSEGLPRALIEAMARALPAVATNVGGITELLPSHRLVPPASPDRLASAIEQLAASPEKLAEASARNLDVAHRYCLSRQQQRMNGWLEFLAETSTGDPTRRRTPSEGGRPSASCTKVIHVFGAMDRGGAELRTIDLARRVPDVASVYVTLSGREGELATMIREDGGVIRPCRLSPTFPMRFAQLLIRERPDVIVSNVATFSGAILLVARLAGVPRRVAHLRSDGDQHGNSLRRRAQRGLMRRLLALCATDIVGNAPGALRFALSARSTPRGRTTVLPDGVEPGPQPIEDAPLGSVRRLVHVARPLPSKRRLRAVEILAAARRSGLDLHLDLVGAMAEDERRDLQHRARALGVDEFVQFSGIAENVPDILSGAHALLVTSTREGLPGVVLEALAAGCPVVSTKLPGTLYVADHCRGVTMLDAEASDTEWVSALVGLDSPAMPGRHEIWRSFRESPFTMQNAAEGVSALWRPA